MTALTSGHIQRIFSSVGRYSTGLLGSKTHEASQDFGDLSETVSGGFRNVWCRHCGRLDGNLRKSSFGRAMRTASQEVVFGRKVELCKTGSAWRLDRLSG